MANEEQLAILRQGVEVWNRWRREHLNIELDLRGAHLSEANLGRANLERANLEDVNLQHANLKKTRLSEAKLYRADLRHANLAEADLSGADLQRVNLAEADLRLANLERTNLREADLHRAILYQANLEEARLYRTDLREAKLEQATLRKANLTRARLEGTNLRWVDLQQTNLREANLEGATLCWAQLQGADLQQANLKGVDLGGANLQGVSLRWTKLQEANLEEADLQFANLIEVKLDQSILTRCKVYGLSVWDMEGTPKDQSSLIITPTSAPTITVDDLEVAQFIYLLLKREKLRNAITTITSKAVLILGRFTPERKAVLDAMADELRKHNLLPIIFDFEGATTRDVTETIKILAGLSLFVIADITNPKSAPLELQALVPDYEVPFIPIIQEGEQPFSMFHDLRKYPWMLTPVIQYLSVEKLLEFFEEGILDPAWEKHQQLMEQKGKAAKSQSIEDFVRSRRGEE